MDPLLSVINQHQKAYQLVQKLRRLQYRTGDDYRNENSFELLAKTEWMSLEKVMDERNKTHSKKNAEFVASFRELERKKSELTGEANPYKSSRFPAIVQPISPSEKFSILATEGSRNVSSLSQKVDSLRSTSSRNDHDVNAFIASIRNTLPASTARLNRLRQEFKREHYKRNKPYSGEWGPQSYQPWQMMNYFLVRPLVEELVNGVLGIVTMSRPKSLASTTLPVRDRLVHQMPTNARVLQLIVEEITLEETQKLCRSTCAEMLDMQKIISDQMDSSFLQIFQKASLIGCETMTSASFDALVENLPTQFNNLKKNRTKHRSKTWSHSQHLQLHPWRQLTGDSISAPDDVRVIDFDLLVPFDLIDSKSTTKAYRSDVGQSWKQKMDIYRQREAEYWSSMLPNGLTLSLTENCTGISAAKPSFSGRCMAVGTTLGNLFVIDFNLTPPRPIKVKLGLEEGQVIDIAWSLDSFKLIAVTDKGVLSIWSLLSDKNLMNAVDHSKSHEAEHDSRSSEQLLPLFKLDAAVQDFKFYTGPLAETSAHNNSMRPVLAAFHPSLTRLGSQPSVCVVVDSNDVMKCDLSDHLCSSDEQGNIEESEANKPSPVVNYPKVLPPSRRVNVIGSDIEVELFRQHQHPVMLMGFIGNSRDMVTVDNAGFINIWKYRSEFLTKEEVFRPSLRYRLSLTKTQYVPSGHSEVIFVHQENDKTRSALEIEQERNKVESQISLAMKDLDLWHYRYYDDQQSPTQMYIHKPSEGIGSTGGTFHVISRFNKTQLLSSYLTQHYHAVRVTSSRLLTCKLSPSGKEAVFLLLFPLLSPKEAHITVVVLDLCEMRLKDFRQDIILTDDGLYQRCLEENIVSCDITDSFGATGSQYVFVMIDGQLSGYSVTTGQKVFVTTAEKDPSFIGCQFKQKKLNVSSDSMLAVNYTSGKLFLSIFTPKQKKSVNPLFILQLTDGSTEQTKLLLRNSVVQWHGDTEPHRHIAGVATVPSTSQVNVKAMVQEILESIVNHVLEESGGITPGLHYPRES